MAKMTKFEILPVYDRRYGSHRYTGSTKVHECEYVCGCWKGPDGFSYGPIGLDPNGECPNNPVNGVRLDDDSDFQIVVLRRILSQERRIRELEKQLEQVDPGAIQLAEELRIVKAEMARASQRLRTIQDLLI